MLDAKIGAVGADVTLLRQDLRNAVARITETESRISVVEDDVKTLKRKMAAMEQSQKGLALRAEDAEGRARRNNLRFVGFPERCEKGNMELFLTQWLESWLAPGVLSTCFVIERAHRALTQRPPEGERPRPVIARLLNYHDRDTILREARARDSITYENQRIMIFPDYSKLVQQQRHSFVEAKAKLRGLKILYSLLYPARLRVIYQSRTHFFNTPEDVFKWTDETVSAYEKGEIWVDIARAVRSEGGPRRRLRNIKKRWQDIRCWSRRIARVQLKLEAPRRHGGSRQLTPNMLRVLEVVFPDLHRQLQEGQQHEGASSSESGGDRGADQAEGHTDSATCWEVSEGGSGTEWEESLQAARHVTDTSYHADESETDSQEGGEYAAMVTHTSLAALPSSSPISNLPLLGVPRVRASPRVSFVPGTAAPAPVSPAALSAETVDLLRQIAVGQASMLSVLHGHTQLITQVVSFMEGMSSAMSDLRRSVAAIESTLTAAMYTQQHLSPPHPSEPSTSASHIPTQHTRTRHRSDTPSAHTQHKKLKAPRTQSQGQVGTPTGRGETPHTHIHTPSRTDSQPCTSTPNVSPGSGGSFSALAEVCSQVFESTFGDAPTSVDESTTPAPTPPVLPSPVHAVPEDSTDGAPIVSTAD
ncbi:uncharacterized protein LOC144790772 [Lissotriton helveticus]